MSTKRIRNLCLALAATAGSMSAASSAGAATCTMGFGSSGLSFMSDGWQVGVANPPYYQEWCGSIGWWMYVGPEGGLQVSHYHFWADDPTINCITFTDQWPNGVMGRQSGSVCNAVDPYTTSRHVTPHDPGYYIHIVNNSTSQPWRAKQIWVQSTLPARVLVENTDGTWWQYTNLTNGAWDLVDNGHKAKNVYVMNQNSTPVSPTTFDNFVIEGPL